MAIVLSTNALTTLETVKMQLEIELEETIYDERLKFAINIKSDFLATECNRVFGKATYTETYQGTGTNKLTLKKYPLVSITSITDANGNITLPTNCTIDNSSSIIDSTVIWDMGNNYTVVYVAGYVLPKDDIELDPRTLPYDLESACIELVAVAYQMRGSEHLKQEYIGPLRSFYIEQIPFTVQEVIDDYRDRGFV